MICIKAEMSMSQPIVGTLLASNWRPLVPDDFYNCNVNADPKQLALVNTAPFHPYKYKLYLYWKRVVISWQLMFGSWRYLTRVLTEQINQLSWMALLYWEALVDTKITSNHKKTNCRFQMSNTTLTFNDLIQIFTYFES